MPSTQNRLIGKSESPVGMVERAYQCRKKHSSFLEYGLLVLLILMLLGAIVTLGVFYSIGEQGYPAPLPSPNPFLPRASHVPERSQPCRVGQRVGVCQGPPRLLLGPCC